MKASSTSAALALVPVALFGLLPLSLVLGSGVLAPPGAWGGASLGALSGTLLAAGGAALFAGVVGSAFAVAIACTDLPGRETLRAALSLPLVVPPYCYAIAWIALANPQSGLLQGPLGGALDVYGTTGLVLVLGWCEVPLVLLPGITALRSIDASLYEAARLSGATRLRAVRTVLLPLARPALGSGVALAFVSAAASFGVPYLLGTGGGAGRVVLTTAIVRALDVGTPDARARAAALATLLLVSVLPALVAGGWLARSGRALVVGKAGKPVAIPLGRARRPFGAVAWAVVLAGVALPLGTVALTSVLRVFGEGVGPHNWSLGSWREVLGRPAVAAALGRSALYASLAAAICAALGAVLAAARDRGRSRLARAVAAVAELPYAVPGTVLAVGLLLAYSREIRVVILDRATFVLALSGTGAMLVVAYAVKGLALGIRNAAAGLGGIDPTLVEAARIAGSSPAGATARITLPLLSPALRTAFALVLLPALGEITMSVMLFSPDTETAGVTLFDLQGYADPPAAAVLATILVAVAVSGLAGAAAVSRLRAARRAP
jgi:iron(III) transport system permease protein